MEPDLFRLKLLLVVIVMAAVLLCAYVLQRLYYYYKTRKVESIDTIRVHVYPDGILAFMGLLLILAAVAAFSLMRAMGEYHSVNPGEALMEIDTGTVGGGELTLSIYTGSDSNTPLAQPDAVYFLPAGGFEVVIEEVSFRSYLGALGQPKLLRPLEIRGVTGPTARKGESKPFSLALGEPPPDTFLSWLYRREAKIITLRAPDDLKARDVLALKLDDDERPVLVRVERDDLP